MNKRQMIPHPLRREREQRGWSRSYVAELLEVEVATVGRWERGESIPHPNYRQRLCELFAKNAQELGLLPEMPNPANDQDVVSDVSLQNADAPDLPIQIASKETQRSGISSSFRRPRRIALMSLVGLGVTALGGGVWGVTHWPSPRPTAAQPTAVKTSPGGNASPSPTASSGSPGNGSSGKYTFEDGGLDGWNANTNVGINHIVSVRNSTAYARDGSHSLKVVFYSTSGNDLPFVWVHMSSGEPVSGERVTAYVYVPVQSVQVDAQVFVQDSTYQWYHVTLTHLTYNQWIAVSFTVPQTKGSINALGLQFLAETPNEDATIYVDSVSW
jgi:transcriptional regulator with XRE-family HTH domain